MQITAYPTTVIAMVMGVITATQYQWNGCCDVWEGCVRWDWHPQQVSCSRIYSVLTWASNYLSSIPRSPSPTSLYVPSDSPIHHPPPSSPSMHSLPHSPSSPQIYLFFYLSTYSMVTPSASDTIIDVRFNVTLVIKFSLHPLYWLV
jgi:hypothetical protein